MRELPTVNVNLWNAPVSVLPVLLSRDSGVAQWRTAVRHHCIQANISRQLQSSRAIDNNITDTQTDLIPKGEVAEFPCRFPGAESKPAPAFHVVFKSTLDTKVVLTNHVQPQRRHQEGHQDEDTSLSCKYLPAL